LAEMTKTPYTKVMLHALIPACLYFAGIFLTIDLRAEKEGLTPLGASIEKGRLSFERGATCLVPLASIVGALLIGFSPMKSALFGIVSLTVIWMIRREKRMTVVDLLAALESGATTMVPVALACACAGIIVGFISLTGLGVKMSAMVSILGVHKLVALVLAMIVCLILGMGMPVAAAYILASATVGGMLVRVGVPLIQAHLFILYFATISAITPPVALAAYAAAGIADADPNAVGWQASKLALSGFIVPFMFIYGPSLMGIGAPARILQAAATSFLGVFCLSIVVEGWFRGPVPIFERILFLGGALLLIDTGLATDIAGLALIVVLLGRRLLRKDASLERTPGTL
ncbi:MAG: TRAP transporter permease, partial [Bacillota bacterium]